MKILFGKTKKTNKIISFIILFCLLFSGMAYTKTQKAHALWGVLDTNVEGWPTLFFTIYDALTQYASLASDYIQEYLQGEIAFATNALYLKEYILDPALWAIAKDMIKNYIFFAVEWARTGSVNTGGLPMLGTSDGGPLFVTDLKKLLFDGVFQQSGIFINSYWSSDIYAELPEPWRDNIGLALMRDRTDAVSYDFPESTLHDDIETEEGMTEFMHLFYDPGDPDDPNDDFGGWPAWLSLFDQPTNLPMGMYAEVSSEMNTEASAFSEQLGMEAQMDSGYIGEKVCKDFSEPPNPDLFPGLPLGGLEIYCSKWITESPGDWVAGQVIETTTSELRSFEAADEFSELLFVLLESLAASLIGPDSSLLGQNYDPWSDDNREDWEADYGLPLCDGESCECDPTDPDGDCYDPLCDPHDPLGDCYRAQEDFPPTPTPPPPPDPDVGQPPMQVIIIDGSIMPGVDGAEVIDGALQVIEAESFSGI